MTRIEIIAVGTGRLYSLGYVTISRRGDVCRVLRIQGADLHLSRHASGHLYLKSKKPRLSHPMGKRVSMKSFKGIEFLGPEAYDLEHLPELFRESRLHKCNGIFAVDTREYRGSPFNLTVALLTNEGLPKLQDWIRRTKQRQLYLFADCSPMIAVAVWAGALSRPGSRKKSGS